MNPEPVQSGSSAAKTAGICGKNSQVNLLWFFGQSGRVFSYLAAVTTLGDSATLEKFHL